MNISSSYVVPLVGFGEQRSFVLLYNILIHLYKRKMALFLKKDRGMRCEFSGNPCGKQRN